MNKEQTKLLLIKEFNSDGVLATLMKVPTDSPEKVPFSSLRLAERRFTVKDFNMGIIVKSQPTNFDISFDDIPQSGPHPYENSLDLFNNPLLVNANYIKESIHVSRTSIGFMTIGCYPEYREGQFLERNFKGAPYVCFDFVDNISVTLYGCSDVNDYFEKLKVQTKIGKKSPYIYYRLNNDDLQTIEDMSWDAVKDKKLKKKVLNLFKKAMDTQDKEWAFKRLLQGLEKLNKLQ